MVHMFTVWFTGMWVLRATLPGSDVFPKTKTERYRFAIQTQLPPSVRLRDAIDQAVESDSDDPGLIPEEVFLQNKCQRGTAKIGANGNSTYQLVWAPSRRRRCGCSQYSNL